MESTTTCFLHVLFYRSCYLIDHAFWTWLIPDRLPNPKNIQLEFITENCDFVTRENMVLGSMKCQMSEVISSQDSAYWISLQRRIKLTVQEEIYCKTISGERTREKESRVIEKPGFQLFLLNQLHPQGSVQYFLHLYKIVFSINFSFCLG